MGVEGMWLQQLSCSTLSSDTFKTLYAYVLLMAIATQSGVCCSMIFHTFRVRDKKENKSKRGKPT